ncbi:UNVERIFIED_CONTAM: hypothetical protein PYX00_006525 [Menopon gallinae]|uniref:RRM domain-containing protein n=1 Tax=Menopon gallinae TaxID=328185 RepID=A0AAW2HX60_9NEOP
MTNRRKGSKGRASLSKKSESPDKSRRVSRRGRRSRKSDSPEQPEEVCSEYSVDENTEEDEGKTGYDNDRDNSGSCRDSDQYETGKSLDDQKVQSKEEESGGSDGSWKVKSENGGSGGIPKLKLCLTRPPDVSSPTSEQPSPRRRRRTRGNASPAPEQLLHHLDDSAMGEKESPKRSTRSQKAKEAAELEAAAEQKHIEDKETVRSEICDSTNINHSENEDETQIAVDSIIDIKKDEETEENVRESLPDAAEQEAEKETHFQTEPEPEKEQESVPNLAQNEIIESSCTEEVKEEPTKVAEEVTEVVADEQEGPESSEGSVLVKNEKRSPSRDSSEERAKEEALRSRNKYKKVEGSEESEVTESTMSERCPPVSKVEDVDKNQVESMETKNDIKENQEECLPAKANNRKRRWGASASRVTKKPPVSISTDFLKEIIPEVKPLLISEVQLSPNEEEEEGQVKDSDENLPVLTKKVDREKMVQSDESEKDYEEEAVESGAEESPKNESVKTTPQAKDKEFTTFTRKVSVLPSNDLNRLQRSPSPPRHKPSNILYIVNLVRPFTIPQLRELLARTGTIAEDGFWIDKIKSRCFVKYETEEEAKTTRHALHGVRWPVSNPKQL